MQASDLPLEYNAVDILERNLIHRANKVALYSEDRELTFQAVSDEVNRVGNALKRLNVRIGESVGLLAPDSAEWATSCFGILKVGAVAVCLNTMLKPHEFAYMLHDSRARVLIVHVTLLTAIQPIRRELPLLERVIVIGGHSDGDSSFEAWIGGESTELEAAPTHRDDFGTLNYSSGTTGEPKGIFHAHKDYVLTAQLWGVDILGLGEADRTFSNAKLFFVFGLGGNLFFPWYVGASTVLRAGSPRDTPAVLQTVERFRPTVLFNAPTGYAAALALSDLTTRYDLSSLRVCVSAGEALPAPLWHRWQESTGLEIIDGIGSTEMFHIFISNRPGEVRPGSSGKPVAGYEVKVLDDVGAAVRAGEVGTLLVKGESAALFYLHQYERSRQTFLGEWLNTGDKYYVDDDGFYWHAGRTDDMLKVGGIWVSPVEVESALMEHPAVTECAVIGVKDGAGLTKPKAWVVVAPGCQAGDSMAAELVAHCVDRMAAYKRPRWIEFTEVLPKTATGKIQRYKLRDLSAAPPPT